MVDLREDDRFVGEVIARSRRKDLVVESLNLAKTISIYTNPGRMRAQIGDMVAGRLLDGVGGSQRGILEHVFSADNTVDLANEVMLAVENIPHEWPENFEPGEIPTQATGEIADRIDLRELALVTIDGSDAKDFDDAVYCKPCANGWRLTVAIADVAHYVKPGGFLDVEARRRGTSVYLPGRVVPMLPQELSNGICSLQPAQDRLALVCDMHLGHNGQIVESKFYEAVIRSHARLTYREVSRFLRYGEAVAGGAPVRDSLLAFEEAYKVLAKAAQTRGALDFNTMETIIEIQQGSPRRVLPVKRNNAHRMIEMAMIAANVQAAQFLESHGETPLNRMHEPPDSWQMKLILNRLASRGVVVPRQVETSSQLQRVLVALRKVCKPSHIWEVMLLSTMAQAHYTPRKLGHFGLALRSYVHFTSPIRRYPDLAVHRMIKGVLQADQSPSMSFNELEKLGAQASICERRATNADRRVQGWLKASLLKAKIGQTLTGTVTGVRDFGLFVELDTYYISGLLHVSNLPRDYYTCFGDELRGEANGRIFRLGDRMSVRLLDVHAPSAKFRLKLA